MTAIAYKDGVMAGDTMTVYDTHIKFDQTKVFEVDGWLYGAAGDCPSNEDLERWLFDGREPNERREQFPNREFDVLLVGYDHDIYFIRHFGDVEKVPGDYFAIGAGAEFCMGAMAVGASAAGAVDTAIRHIDNVGGSVTTVRLHD